MIQKARARLVPFTGKPLSAKRKTVAFAIAAAADVLQLAVFPAFSEGAFSPFEDVLDVVVAIALTVTLGFHYRLALAFLLELVPGADLFPTWTAVVMSMPVTATAEQEMAVAPARMAAY